MGTVAKYASKGYTSLKALDHYINSRLLLFLKTGCGWAGYGRLRNTAYSKNE